MKLMWRPNEDWIVYGWARRVSCSVGSLDQALVTTHVKTLSKAQYLVHSSITIREGVKANIVFLFKTHRSVHASFPLQY